MIKNNLNLERIFLSNNIESDDQQMDLIKQLLDRIADLEAGQEVLQRRVFQLEKGEVKK